MNQPTCEVMVDSYEYGQSKRKHRVTVPCGKAATHVWTPRGETSSGMLVCRAHGEGLAGNWTDELKLMVEKKEGA